MGERPIFHPVPHQTCNNTEESDRIKMYAVPYLMNTQRHYGKSISKFLICPSYSFISRMKWFTCMHMYFGTQRLMMIMFSISGKRTKHFPNTTYCKTLCISNKLSCVRCVVLIRRKHIPSRNKRTNMMQSQILNSSAFSLYTTEKKTKSPVSFFYIYFSASDKCIVTLQ